MIKDFVDCAFLNFSVQVQWWQLELFFKLAQPELWERLQAASGLIPACFAAEHNSSPTNWTEESCLTGNLRINKSIWSQRILPESIGFHSVILLFQGLFRPQGCKHFSEGQEGFFLFRRLQLCTWSKRSGLLLKRGLAKIQKCSK